MIGKLLKMQLLEDDDELAYTPDADSGTEVKEADGRPAWMRTLSKSLHTWSEMLPKVFTPSRCFTYLYVYVYILHMSTSEY